MYFQFFCAKPVNYGYRCLDDNTTWLGTSMDLYCCKGKMCNDVTTNDNNYKQNVLRSCKNINEKRKNDSDLDKELIDCSLVS